MWVSRTHNSAHCTEITTKSRSANGTAETRLKPKCIYFKASLITSKLFIQNNIRRKEARRLYIPCIIAQSNPIVTFQNLEPFRNDHEQYRSSEASVETEQLSPNQHVEDQREWQYWAEDDLGSPGLINLEAVHEEEEPLPVIPPIPEITKLKREIHFTTPLAMIGALFCGFFMALFHHLYYNFLEGKVVHGPYGQQTAHLQVPKTLYLNYRLTSNSLGNFFAAMTLLCPVASIDIAYTQWLFLSLMSKIVTVKCVDAMYGARGSLLFMLNLEMFRKLPIITALALIMRWAF